MKIYILTKINGQELEPILGISLDIKLLKGSVTTKWEIPSPEFIVLNEQAVMLGRKTKNGPPIYAIHAHDLLFYDDVVQQFALGVLAGESTAIDAVKDILRI